MDWQNSLFKEITFDRIDVSMAEEAVQCPYYDDRDRVR